MARARLLSASLGSSEKFHDLEIRHKRISEFAQVLFCLLVPNVDDYGRCEGGSFTVKHRIFPSSSRAEKSFASALIALADVGLIQLYEIEGKHYIQVVNFDAHQSSMIHRRTKSRYPGPPNHPSPEFPGNSGKEPEIPSQSNRIESNRTSRESSMSANADDSLIPTLVEQMGEGSGEGETARRVFAYWCEEMNHPKAVLDANRKRKILARLREGRTEAELKMAIDGCKLSPFHQGKNADHKTYHDIELICRNAAKLEEFIDRAQRRRPPPSASNGDWRIRWGEDLREVATLEADPAKANQLRELMTELPRLELDETRERYARIWKGQEGNK